MAGLHPVAPDMPRRKPVSAAVLHERLDALAANFDIATIEPDPLQVVLRYDAPLDQEIVGLLAASFAYGRASVVVDHVGVVAARMTPSPSAWLASFERKEAERRFAGFSHRFHKTRDLVDLLERMAAAVAEHGSLGELFRAGWNPDDSDIGPALTRFVEALLTAGGRKPSKALEYLLSSPANGSACKRMNLYLRWMVRRTSPDLGLWRFVDPAKLVMPVDTHIHRIATFLGLNDRKSADWRSARGITDRLAAFDPADPVRYDFALCRLGILDLCSRKRRAENCEVCLLRDACGFPVPKSKGLDGQRKRGVVRELRDRL